MVLMEKGGSLDVHDGARSRTRVLNYGAMAMVIELIVTPEEALSKERALVLGAVEWREMMLSS